MVCGTCGVVGHNSRTCRAELDQPPLKRPKKVPANGSVGRKVDKKCGLTLCACGDKPGSAGLTLRTHVIGAGGWIQERFPGCDWCGPVSVSAATGQVVEAAAAAVETAAAMGGGSEKGKGGSAEQAPPEVPVLFCPARWSIVLGGGGMKMPGGGAKSSSSGSNAACTLNASLCSPSRGSSSSLSGGGGVEGVGGAQSMLPSMMPVAVALLDSSLTSTLRALSQAGVPDASIDAKYMPFAFPAMAVGGGGGGAQAWGGAAVGGVGCGGGGGGGGGGRQSILGRGFAGFAPGFPGAGGALLPSPGPLGSGTKASNNAPSSPPLTAARSVLALSPSPAGLLLPTPANYPRSSSSNNGVGGVGVGSSGAAGFNGFREGAVGLTPLLSAKGFLRVKEQLRQGVGYDVSGLSGERVGGVFHGLSSTSEEDGGGGGGNGGGGVEGGVQRGVSDGGGRGGGGIPTTGRRSRGRSGKGNVHATPSVLVYEEDGENGGDENNTCRDGGGSDENNFRCHNNNKNKNSCSSSGGRKGAPRQAGEELVAAGASPKSTKKSSGQRTGSALRMPLHHGHAQHALGIEEKMEENEDVMRAGGLTLAETSMNSSAGELDVCAGYLFGVESEKDDDDDDDGFGGGRISSTLSLGRVSATKPMVLMRMEMEGAAATATATTSKGRPRGVGGCDSGGVLEEEKEDEEDDKEEEGFEEDMTANEISVSSVLSLSPGLSSLSASSIDADILHDGGDTSSPPHSLLLSLSPTAAAAALQTTQYSAADKNCGINQENLYHPKHQHAFVGAFNSIDSC